ncbi:MAG: ABC transporter substrate-binding protein [Oscillospiraceae bacterium]|nr:ABC transporter substrate-binding protein [Oscillospiraceae bacterium]
MKKIIALLLASVMILALVGCGSSSREVVQLTFATQDAEAILAAAGILLPDAEDTAVSGTTVKWFAWYDDLQNYSEDEIINSGYWTFQEKYGCSVQWVECTWDTRYDELANLILASNAPDFYPGDNEIFPNSCIKGIFVPVDDYIDYDDPLWADEKEYAYTYFSIKDRPYIIVYDNTFGNVCAYNRRVMEEFGFDDPAELYYNDEWTWDVFYDMCLEFTDADEDRYALDGFWYGQGLMHSCGETIVVYNTETMQFEDNSDSAAIERAATLLYDLSKNGCIYPRWNNTNWNTRNDSTTGAGIKEGLCLFYIGGTWMFTDTVETVEAVWGDMSEGELMFVPLPRDDDGNGYYYTESASSGYCIVQGASNPEGVALLASCMRFKVLDPTVVSIDRLQLENTYLWTQDMLEMYDECYALATSNDNVLVVYGAGYGTKLESVVSTYEGIADSSDAMTWAQIKESYDEQLAYYIDQLNNQVAAYDPYSLDEDYES